jgi:hypothetical protein
MERTVGDAVLACEAPTLLIASDRGIWVTTDDVEPHAALRQDCQPAEFSTNQIISTLG